MAPKEKKSNRGRPVFAATEEIRHTVETMVGIGIGQSDISRALRIDEKTLRKHFRDELDTGKTKLVTRIADSLMRQALAGNVGAAAFFLKTQAGWRERVDVNTEVTGRGGGAVQVEASIDEASVARLKRLLE